MSVLEDDRHGRDSGLSRILTLVFTDLAGSTALKTERGDHAVSELITRHRTLIGRLAAESDGRIIDWAGDGCFLTFETPSAAVLFALRLQRAHGEESDLPGVRTGIHLGEVSERPGPDGDEHARVEGLAVDLAARICGLARPAQVLMSSSVADSARQRLDGKEFGRPIRWQSYGSYSLKGFGEALEIREAGLEGIAPLEAPTASEKATPATSRRSAAARRRTLPVAIFSIVVLSTAAAYLGYLLTSSAPDPSSVGSHGAAVPGGAETNGVDALTVPGFGGRPAIAVLPFDNLSADSEQAFFADGLAEDLITRLSSWRAFPVIARNSSFRYRGGNVDPRRVSQDLGVRYLVEGSVRRAGDRIRVTAQLIDAPSGEHLWAETYDREVTDVFVLQDEISSIIAASLVGDLTRAEGERAHQRGTDNLEAWSLYQLGLQHFDHYTLEDFSKARRLFERAAELDPRFATALGQFAIAATSELMLGYHGPREELVANMTANARRAVALDPRDPAAHLGLAGSYLSAGDSKNGLESIRRAVDLNPSMPQAWIWLGWTQAITGDSEAAIIASEHARRLSPQGPMVWIYDNLALAYWELGRYEEALEAAERLVAAQPTYLTGYAYIAMNLVALGRREEAHTAIVEGRRVQPELSLELMQNYIGVSRPEIDARRNDALREAGLE
jgi:TolB-like protein/class 3 adenylate cyclase/Flp pilus assembly protein TadD